MNKDGKNRGFQEEKGQILSRIDDLRRIHESQARTWNDKYQGNLSEHSLHLEEVRKNLVLEKATLENEISEMVKFYEEKIEALEEQQTEAVKAFGERPSRSCDLAAIADLETELQRIMNQLHTAVKELREYKRITVLREGDYNSRFGGKRNVGVLDARRVPQ
jgi:hypothetical protein